MKKLLIIAIAIIGIVFANSSNAMAGTLSPFCPDGPVNMRIDRNGSTPIAATGSWVELNRRLDEDGELDWGNSGCIDPGTSCHSGDWYTWWTGVYVPPVNEGCNPEPITFIPAGYNPTTGEYLMNLGN